MVGRNGIEFRPTIWATVCKTVRRMLSDRCLCVVSVCLVTLLYCGQTVEWIKMPLGTEVGFGPGDIVLDGDPVSPKRGAQQPPLFGRCSLRPNGCPSQQLLSSCYTVNTHSSLQRQLQPIHIAFSLPRYTHV